MTILKELERCGLLDERDGVLVPHNWSQRQYKSDVSNERVKRHRQRQCNVTSTVTVTPPDTDTESEQKDGGQRGAPILSDDCFSIAREIGQVCGYAEPSDWPVGWSQAHHRVQAWLNEGWPKDAILAACKDAMARKTDGPPSTINYFDKPIARWLAKQAAPLPEIKIQPRGTVHVRPAESDSRGQFREALAELRQFNRGGAPEHGGSGETISLLRPAGRG
jgi:hypothetical protein